MGMSYVFMRYDLINSNPFSLSIISPLFDERLTAGWPNFNILAISTVLTPSFRCTQKHNSDLAFTVCGDLPKAIT